MTRSRGLPRWPVLAGGAAVLLFALLGRHLAHLDPLATVAAPWSAPSGTHPFGADGLGRDVLTRVLWGGRELTALALAAAAAATGLGVFAGLWAGWHGHRTRSTVTAGADLMLAVPAILMALVLAVAAPMPLAVVCATVLAGAPLTARVVADLSAGTRHAAFVDVARMRGDRTSAILLLEVLPAHKAVLVTDYALRLVVAIQLVATVNALGLGTAPPTPDWALMIAENYAGMALNPAATVAPACALALLATTVGLVAAAFDTRRST